MFKVPGKLTSKDIVRCLKRICIIPRPHISRHNLSGRQRPGLQVPANAEVLLPGGNYCFEVAGSQPELASDRKLLVSPGATLLKTAQNFEGARKVFV